ncbi:MAG: hypothetical protein LBL23_02805 [Coriobacteriales bacterium]|jgi:Tfp pilus assembly protein PilN|nr:hypothetical protein [Coriobacteriales bacterium]
MAKTVRQKEINFLTVLVGRRTRKKINASTLIMPCVLLLVVLVGVGAFTYLSMATAQIDAQSDTIREYLNSPDTTRQLAEAQSTDTEAKSMAALAETTAAPIDNLASYPDLTTAQYTQILEYAGANIQLSTINYTRDTGSLTFSGTTEYVLSISTFIAQLRNSGLFSDVVYLGYSGSVPVASQLSTPTSRSDTSPHPSSSASATTGEGSTGNSEAGRSVVETKPSYTFSVECSLKAPEPPAAETEEN